MSTHREDCGLLDCDAVESSRWLQHFRKHIMFICRTEDGADILEFPQKLTNKNIGKKYIYVNF
jgi:hypothetical protein